MSGISRDIIPDSRSSLVNRHLPGTSQFKDYCEKRGEAHVFNDLETLKRVTKAIIDYGERTGVDDRDDDYERYGLYFPEAIGYIIRFGWQSSAASIMENLKIVKATGEYHAVPRTGPRRTS